MMDARSIDMVLESGISMQMRIKGVSKAELARRLCVSPSAVTGYFRDGIGTKCVLLRVCDALGLELVIREVSND